jgi:hypothetical protein
MNNNMMNLIYCYTQSDYINQIKKTNEKLDELEYKYFNLVWYARREPEEAAKYFPKELYEKFKKELEELADPESGDWHHGFNSGMLACSRLISHYLLNDDNINNIIKINNENDGDDDDYIPSTRKSVLEMEIEFAEDHFPDLDT